MRVIVTGASGLLGRYVVGALVQGGVEVTGVDLAPAASGAVGHITADLTDFGVALEVVRDADAVIHAAAIPRPTGHAPRDVFHTNVTAAYNVIEATVLAGVERLVYASSYSVIGLPFNVMPVAPSYFPIDAAHPVAPQDAYALSKWLGEEVIAAAVRRSGLSAVSLRMPWIQTPATFRQDIAGRDEAFLVRSLWAYIDARDAGEAFRAALGARIQGHKRLFISAADTFKEEETASLLAKHFPAVPLHRPIGGRNSVFALEEAREVLGFVPRFSWRSY
jgi:nucleoside-diphosphate-sugar epimerase